MLSKRVIRWLSVATIALAAAASPNEAEARSGCWAGGPGSSACTYTFPVGGGGCSVTCNDGWYSCCDSGGCRCIENGGGGGGEF